MFNDKNKKIYYILLFLGLISIYWILSYTPAIFNDYPWHFVAGKWMFENNKILTHNIFSYAIPESQTFYSHEWLAEIIIFVTKNIFQYDFIFLFIMIAIIFIVIAASSYKDVKDKNAIGFLFFYIMCLLSFLYSKFARPLLFSLLFSILLLKAINEINKNSKNKLYLYMPLITVFWSNTHGGTVAFAVLFPILYLFCGQINISLERYYQIKNTKEQNKKYLYLIIGNFIASLINPFTYKIYLFPFTINNNVSKEGISEWSRASLDWTITIIAIILIVLFLLFTKSKIKINDLLLLFGLMLLTLIYGRFYSWLFMAGIIILPKYFEIYKENKKLENFIYTYILAFIIMFFGFFIYTIFTKPVPKIDNLIDNKLIETIKNENPEKLFNSYDIGGLLNYYDIKCFASPIAELYPEDVIACGIKLENMKVSLTDCNSYFDFDYYLVLKNSPLDDVLKNDNKYELLYESLYDKENATKNLYNFYKINN